MAVHAQEHTGHQLWQRIAFCAARVLAAHFDLCAGADCLIAGQSQVRSQDSWRVSRRSRQAGTPGAPHAWPRAPPACG